MEKFLKVPFYQDEKISISEGWIYSDEEFKIHGHKYHKAVDFVSERGTPVFAAADGYALASFNTGYAGEFEGKRVGLGLGNFVIIWHPETDTYTSYAHLNSLEKGIPFIEPSKLSFFPTILISFGLRLASPAYFRKKGVKVRTGDCIGAMGDSGLSWGYEEEVGKQRDCTKLPSWDEVHLHFQVHIRRGLFRFPLDPFGIYSEFRDYDLNSHEPKNIWLIDSEGKVLFAGRREH